MRLRVFARQYTEGQLSLTEYCKKNIATIKKIVHSQSIGLRSHSDTEFPSSPTHTRAGENLNRPYVDDDEEVWNVIFCCLIEDRVLIHRPCIHLREFDHTLLKSFKLLQRPPPYLLAILNPFDLSCISITRSCCSHHILIRQLLSCSEEMSKRFTRPTLR